MLVLLSCAKTMAESPAEVGNVVLTTPRFIGEARATAAALSKLDPSVLAKQLRVNAGIASENKLRYLDFSVDGKPGLPALMAYTGIAFRYLSPSDFSNADLIYAQDHLRITSFLYGLLRPLDGILPYRLEGDVRLPEYGDITMFDFWKPKLTDVLIDDVKAAGGVLCNLASDEMRRLFDWKRVAKSVHIVTPAFKVWKGDKPRTVVVYSKMMRGEMARFILKNRLADPDELVRFESPEGFAYDAGLSRPDYPVFSI